MAENVITGSLGDELGEGIFAGHGACEDGRDVLEDDFEFTKIVGSCRKEYIIGTDVIGVLESRGDKIQGGEG